MIYLCTYIFKMQKPQIKDDYILMQLLMKYN